MAEFTVCFNIRTSEPTPDTAFVPELVELIHERVNPEAVEYVIDKVVTPHPAPPGDDS